VVLGVATVVVVVVVAVVGVEVVLVVYVLVRVVVVLVVEMIVEGGRLLGLLVVVVDAVLRDRRYMADAEATIINTIIAADAARRASMLPPFPET